MADDDPRPPTRRVRDGRAWRIGTDADIAWIVNGTSPGLTITSAIPPVFDALALRAGASGAGAGRHLAQEQWRLIPGSCAAQSDVPRRPLVAAVNTVGRRLDRYRRASEFRGQIPAPPSPASKGGRARPGRYPTRSPCLLSKVGASARTRKRGAEPDGTAIRWIG